MTQATGEFVLPGAAGDLQALLELPASDAGTRVAVICHPHPLHGGTMTNKVVHILARTCSELQMPVVRFNFRGVSRSAGTFDHGRGETNDALAAIAWAHREFPGRALWLAGFSFGGAIAVRAAERTPTQALISVAPAISRVADSEHSLPTCPWLIVQGDADELVDVQETRDWAASLAVKPQLVVLPGIDHFFHGRLNDLRNTVLEWAREQRLT